MGRILAAFGLLVLAGVGFSFWRPQQPPQFPQLPGTAPPAPMTRLQAQRAFTRAIQQRGWSKALIGAYVKKFPEPGRFRFEVSTPGNKSIAYAYPDGRVDFVGDW